jgi:subtilisin family serine protease
VDDIPGEWIVELNPGESSEQVASEHEANEGAEVHEVYTAAVDGYAASMSDAEAENIANDPRVRSVTRDRMVYATAEIVPTGVRRIGGTPTSSPGSDVNVDVAVVDTGISAHPDLNIAGGKNCNGTGTSYADGDGHGTHVAGTIGAKNQNSGVVGVAPGARLWAVRVLNNSGSGTWSQIVCGLDWVRAQGNIEVVNMSLGGSGTAGSSCSSSTLRSAICNLVNAGVTVVVAAGNDHVNVSGQVPAAFPEAITVSALADFNGLTGGGGAATCRSDVDDTFADFSNYGAGVDIIAPGVCILSTSRTGGTATMSGTSMASPHVAGAAARYRASNAASPAQVLSYLQANGTYDWNTSGDLDGIKEPLLSTGPPPPPPAQVPPTPNFTSSCNGMTCSFTNTSTDANGDTMTYSWAFGDSSTDTATNPSHTYASAQAYSVTLTATDNDGSNSVTKTVNPTTPPPISLTATRTTSWFSGTYATLRWSGATGSTVDIWRRSSTGTFTKVVANTSNDGSATNSPGSGTWVYKVCLLNNASACSNEATVTI